MFLVKNWFKILFILKHAQFSDRYFFTSVFFFVQVLVFELWLILYLTVVNSALGEKSGRELCEPDSDANQFRVGSSLLKKIKNLIQTLTNSHKGPLS